MKKPISILLSVMLMALLLVGCSQSTSVQTNKSNITIYFYNAQNGAVEVEEVQVVLETNATSEHLMSAVISELYKGPQSGKQVNKPMDLYIKESTLKERIAYITFEETYNELSVEDQVAIRVNLVYSLTELDFVDAVEFNIGDQPLTTNYNTKVGAVTRKDMLINGLNPTPPTTSHTITLYFPKENEIKLYPEYRTIKVNDSTPLEQYVIQELINGPQTPGLLPILPADTKYNDIRTQEFVCYLDLAYNLKNIQLTSPVNERLVIYSLVNSLTEVSKIQKVIFLMDGKKQTDFLMATDSGGLFERNEDIIAK